MPRPVGRVGTDRESKGIARKAMVSRTFAYGKYNEAFGEASPSVLCIEGRKIIVLGRAAIEEKLKNRLKQKAESTTALCLFYAHFNP